MRYFCLIFVIAFCCDARYVPENGVYAVAETLPRYGENRDELKIYLEEKLNTLNYYEEGVVYVSFIVDSLGNVSNSKIAKGLNSLQDSLALSLIQNTPNKWQPGKVNHKAVSVKMVYPVQFSKKNNTTN